MSPAARCISTRASALRLLRLVGRQDQVAELPEAAVRPVPLALGPIEVDRPHAERDRLRRAALPGRCRPRAGRALAGFALLQDHDAFRAALTGEHRGPPADRAGAHDDEVGGLPVRHASLLRGGRSLGDAYSGSDAAIVGPRRRSRSGDGRPAGAGRPPHARRGGPRRPVVVGAGARRGAILSLLEAPIAGVVVAAADQSNAFARQLLGFAVGLAPVFLVLHLVRRSGEGVGAIGLQADRPAGDVARGALLFAFVGLAGIGVYLAAVELGVNRCVVPTPPLGHWWTVPALVLNAVEAALVGGDRPRVPDHAAAAARGRRGSRSARARSSAARITCTGVGRLRGQPRDGGGLRDPVPAVGRRTWPFVVAHALLDIAAGVGFILFRDSLPCF